MKNNSEYYSSRLEKLYFILQPESSFYVIMIIYGVGISLLSLAIPISVQALVNTVTFGVLVQPLVVLSIVLLSLLIFSGALKALQVYIAELLQRHLYARITSEVAIRILNSEDLEFKKQNGVELVNRYFDIMTVQKNLTSLLTGGTAIVLQTTVGLLLLAFYHPYFLVFDLILILSIWLTIKLFSSKAINTAINESKAKYKAASWLEEIARKNIFFKTRKRKRFAIKACDENIESYISSRRVHFRHLFSQIIFLLSIYAIMSSLILGLGGFLVIKGQLTLGQLIAAELVVTVILSGLSKAGKYFEYFYDLIAAVGKISQLYQISAQSSQSVSSFETLNFDLTLCEVALKSHQIRYCYSYNFESSKNYYIHPQSYSSQRVFIEITQKVLQPLKGQVKLGEVSYSLLSSVDLRDNIYVVEKPSVFEGTILENLLLGCDNISPEVLREAIGLVELCDLDGFFDNFLSTRLQSSGYPLQPSQLIRLEIVRCLIHKPKIIILAKPFEQIENFERLKLLKALMKTSMTVIYFSTHDLSELNFDQYLELNKDKIEEFSTYESLKQKIKASQLNKSI